MAQGNPARPKLVVGIVVDQLRTDYIESLRNWFGANGFETLLSEGAYIRDVDFNAARLDASSATAMLVTGSTPSQTGVPSAMVWNSDALALRPALAQSSVTLTNDAFTPEQLRLSTVADEFAVDSDGAAAVYAVSADPQQAVILAGHAGTSALWINNTSGNWASTSYYGPMPSIATRRNINQPVSHRLDTMRWEPTRAAMQFAGLDVNSKKRPFKYTFPKSDRDVYKKFAASPMANAEVTDMAIALIRSLGEQPRTAPDMINVGYSLAPYKYATGANRRVELADAYIRLDAQIGRLVDAIDRYVGRGNALIWLSSTGFYDESQAEDKRFRIPGGEFSVRKAKSLLNSYLSARHGNAGYVASFRDGMVHFDRKVLDDKRLDPAEVIADARSFLVKMSGVADAWTIDEIISGGSASENALRRSLDPRTAGDIIVSFAPGWSVLDDDSFPATVKYVRESPVMTPAIILAPGLKAQVITAPVDATAIAPTVAGILRIRAPNGAVSRPVPAIR